VAENQPDPDRRARWLGRAIIIGFGLLLLVYLIPMFAGLLGR
jgi:hypothetical protein